MNIYQDEILDHYKNPQNFGVLAKYTYSSKSINPFCGDELELFLKVEDDRVEDIRFTGVGCAISIAAASLLTEEVKEKSISELTEFSEKDMLSLLGIDISETRKKCALLAYSTLKDCLCHIK